MSQRKHELRNVAASVRQRLLNLSRAEGEDFMKVLVRAIRRFYGDWTTPQLGSWKTVLLEHSAHPIQQFRYTIGKNATEVRAFRATCTPGRG